MIASRTSFALAMRASMVALSSAAEADRVVSAMPSAQKIARKCFMVLQISKWDIDPHVTKFAAVTRLFSEKPLNSMRKRKSRSLQSFTGQRKPEASLVVGMRKLQ